MINIKKGSISNYSYISNTTYNFILDSEIKDLTNKWNNIFVNQSSSFSKNLNLGDKIFFLPDLKFPKHKFKILSDNVGASKVNKIQNATCLVIEKNYLKNVIDKSKLSNLYLENPDGTFSIADEITNPSIYMGFYDTASFYLKEKLEIIDYIVNNTSNFTFLDINDLYDEFTNYIGIKLDDQTLDTLFQQFESRDNSIRETAMQILANCNFKESPFAIFVLLYINYNGNIKYNNSINISSFLNNFNRQVCESYNLNYSSNLNFSNLEEKIIDILNIFSNPKNIPLSDYDKKLIKTNLDKYFNNIKVLNGIFDEVKLK